MAEMAAVREGFPEEGTPRQPLPGAVTTCHTESPEWPHLPQAARQDRAGPRGPEGLHSRPLQELLLPVGVHQLLWHQLHQLQALLDLHQDLIVLPAPHLSTERWTLCPGACGRLPAQAPQAVKRLSFLGGPLPLPSSSQKQV